MPALPNLIIFLDQVLLRDAWTKIFSLVEYSKAQTLSPRKRGESVCAFVGVEHRTDSRVSDCRFIF